MAIPYRATAMITAAVVCLGLTARGADARQAQQPEEVTIPEAATTLEGVPTVRVDSTEQGTTRVVLRPEEAQKSRLTISRVDGQYRWTSRDNKPLEVYTSGAFTYLSSDPGHYIRFTRLNDRISYVEHVDSPLGSVTYWGELKVVLGK